MGSRFRQRPSAARARWRVAAGLVACSTVCMVSGAGARVAALPQQSGVVDLLSQANVRLEGASSRSFAGTSVAAAGDVNGDGIGDVIVGAPGESNNGRSLSGSAYVVFGRASMGTVSLGALGDGGIRIDGAETVNAAGSSVSAAGDVNGDGLGDVIVGAPGAGAGGKAYVVFGRKTGGTVDLANLGSGGYEIDGAPGDGAGYAVAGGKDVNGDGLPDVVVGAPGAGPNGECSGRVYVVYGKASTTPANLSAGFAGFRMDGAAAGDEAGYSVGMAGDMTGDGLSEVIVGAPSVLAPGCGSFTQRPGAAYVIFSGPGAPNLSLGDPGFSGYGLTIYGAAVGEDTGYSVAGAGDVNGDGHADVLVGDLFTGRAYVIFGRGSRDSSPIYLSAFGGGGFAISSAVPGDRVGCGVAAAGDVNGDGRADVLVGAGNAANNGRLKSGSAYVVFGVPFPQPVNLGALGSGGFRMDGPAENDDLGCEQTVAPAGDFNGDGRPDLIVAAPTAADTAGTFAGVAYVVYGFGTPELAYGPLTATVGAKIAPHAPTLLKRTGAPSFAITPGLPGGLVLDESTGVISGTPAVAQAKTNYTVTMTDLAGRANATLSLEVKKPAPPPPPPPPPAARLRLKAGKLSVAQARAGRPFTVSMTVTDAATGKGVKGQVICTGKIATRLLPVRRRSSTVRGKASCTWQLPKSATGKVFRGSIAEHYKSAKISRSFSTKVR